MAILKIQMQHKSAVAIMSTVATRPPSYSPIARWPEISNSNWCTTFLNSQSAEGEDHNTSCPSRNRSLCPRSGVRAFVHNIDETEEAAAKEVPGVTAHAHCKRGKGEWRCCHHYG